MFFRLWVLAPRIRILSKTALTEREKDNYTAAREKRKTKKDSASVHKEVECSWAISEHDFAHRMKKVREFLGKGWKVSVTLGVKKGMTKQPLGKMEELLTRLRTECEACGKEVADPEGQVGKKYTMLFLGNKVVKKEGEEGEDKSVKSLVNDAETPAAKDENAAEKEEKA